MSFFHTEKTQVGKIIVRVRQDPHLFYIVSIMAADDCRRKEPEH